MPFTYMSSIPLAFKVFYIQHYKPLSWQKRDRSVTELTLGEDIYKIIVFMIQPVYEYIANPIAGASCILKLVAI